MIHTENDQYRGVVQVQVGPMKFNLTGTVGVNREPDKKSWTMKARAQDNRINGGVQATIDAKLSEQSLNMTNLNVMFHFNAAQIDKFQKLELKISLNCKTIFKTSFFKSSNSVSLEPVNLVNLNSSSLNSPLCTSPFS